ncbi:MAG: hypothetical protein J6I72_07760 [Muribaculaceae bacterium]|nr:hypothetical protein [Muribaculaceae bacterium]
MGRTSAHMNLYHYGTSCEVPLYILFWRIWNPPGLKWGFVIPALEQRMITLVG